jgi:hypothetical protein
MTRSAALKAVRTMRANKALRQSHRYRSDYQCIMDTEMGHKHARLERAARAIRHRKRRKRG